MLAIEAPHAGFAETEGTEIGRRIGSRETEVLVFPVKVAFLTGKRDDVGRIEAILLVIQGELMNAAVVGMCGDAVVRDADSHPHSSLHTGTLTYHLHDPCFVGICNGKALPFAVITVFLHQVGHHLDGLTGSPAALQSQVYQTSVINQTGGVGQLGTSAERGLGNGHLILIDVTDDVVGLCHLRDLSQKLVCVPVADVNHLARRMLAGRIMAQVTEHTVRVGGVRNQHRTVSRCSFAYNQVGAGQ